MPVHGLPKILECTLSQVLDELIVSGWSVKGEDDSTTVWIRFRSDTVHPNSSTNHVNATYRKVPPSQLKRNRERAMNWNSDKKQQVEEIQIDNDEIEQYTVEKPTISCAFNQVPHDPIITESFQEPPTPQLDDSHKQEDQSPCVQACVSSAGNATGETAAAITPDHKRHTPKQDKSSTSSRNYHNTRSQTKQHRIRPFYYKSVNVDLSCPHCERDYVSKPPSQSYFCTFCPAFICSHCKEWGYHNHHKETLKGPGTLKSIYDRYSSRY